MKLNKLEYLPKIGRLQLKLTKPDGGLHRYGYSFGDTPTSEETPFVTAVLAALTAQYPYSTVKEVTFDIYSGEFFVDRVKVTPATEGLAPEVVAFISAIAGWKFPGTNTPVTALKQLTDVAAAQPVQVTVDSETTEEVIEVVNGKAVAKKITKTVKTPLYDEYPVVDENGNPVMIPEVTEEQIVEPAVLSADGKEIVTPAVTKTVVVTPARQKMHQVPRMDTSRLITPEQEAERKALQDLARAAITIEKVPAINHAPQPVHEFGV